MNNAQHVYIESETWKDNPYLIQPKTSVKKCSSCEKSLYSVEFPDAPEFEDGKLPVCLQCYRSRDSHGRETVALFEGVTRKCAACGVFKTLDGYSYTKPRNALNKTCRVCNAAKSGTWWEASNAS